jgi:hypothetical protein
MEVTLLIGVTCGWRLPRRQVLQYSGLPRNAGNPDTSVSSKQSYNAKISKLNSSDGLMGPAAVINRCARGKQSSSPVHPLGSINPIVVICFT